MEGILNDEFAPIEFDRRSLRKTGVVYRVYRDSREFAEIEAGSAHEALERSDIKKPYKISRYMLNHLPILDNGMLVQPEQIPLPASEA